MESKVQKAPAICKARENDMAPCSTGECYTSFVATKVCLPRQSFCHKIVLSRPKFSRDEYLSRQAEDVFCRDNSKLFLVATTVSFFCRDKRFVAARSVLSRQK